MSCTCGSCFWFEFLYRDAPYKIGNCIAGGFNTNDKEDAEECLDYQYARRWHKASFPEKRLLP
jgi:hypothetical protein